jgi:phosphate/sulfate permease
MGALGVGSTISASWLQPVAMGLLLLSLSALLVRARRRHSYAPFVLGLLAAVALYWCKFRLNNDLGVYLSMAMLLAASVWNSVAQSGRADDVRCRC